MEQNYTSLRGSLSGKLDKIEGELRNAISGIREGVEVFKSETLVWFSKLEGDNRANEEKLETSFAIQEMVNQQQGADVGEVKSSVSTLRQAVQQQHEQLSDVNKDIHGIRAASQRQDVRLRQIEDTVSGMSMNIRATVQSEINPIKSTEAGKFKEADEVLWAKIADREKRVYAAQRTGMSGAVVGHATLPNYLRSHSENREQPYSFLTELENYFLVNGIPRTHAHAHAWHCDREGPDYTTADDASAARNNAINEQCRAGDQKEEKEGKAAYRQDGIF